MGIVVGWRGVGRGRAVGGGVDGWTYIQTQTNLPLLGGGGGCVDKVTFDSMNPNLK